MSHFSLIKTCINNKDILIKTLNDLGFDYEYKKKDIIHNNYESDIDINVKKSNLNLFGFIWDGIEYSFVADLQLWKYNMPYKQLLETITQQYSYNSIMQESIKQGFTNINEEKMKDGSIKLVIQRWSQ